MVKCVDCGGDFDSRDLEYGTCKACWEEEEQRQKDWKDGIIHEPKR